MDSRKGGVVGGHLLGDVVRPLSERRLLLSSARQQCLDQATDADLAARERRRPSPRGGWAGSTFASMVELIGALWNLDLAELRRLGRLRDKLAAAAPAGLAPKRRVDKRNERGWVLEAVMRVLGGATEPMRMSDVIVKVQAEVGRPVSKSSVENCLCANSRGRRARFSRVGRGRYCLASQAS
jgi:hypothetical protein